MKAKYWYLENTTTRNAFYEVIFLEGDERHAPMVCTSYGKRGTQGRTEFKQCESVEKGVALATALTAGKHAKQYEPVHMEANVVADSGNDIAMAYRGNALGLRSHLKRKISQGDLVSRENALTYIEGFISECELFLRLAQDGSFTEEELRGRYDAMMEKWGDFQDKFDKAKSAIELVQIRAMMVGSR